jgi:PadR family transcriptional regulator PadR
VIYEKIKSFRGGIMLTKFEEQILMTVWKLEGKGYGVNIFQYLNELNEKRITLGVVYDILERLCKKGSIEAHFGEPTPVRGGMRKKYYSITTRGIEELVKERKIYEKIMEGFDLLFQQHKKLKKS